MLKVFVDGAAGTVGSALQPYLEQMQVEGLIELIRVPGEMRKVRSWRRVTMRLADVIVLCLPDDEAADAVALAAEANPGSRILDASTVHRCNDGWVYGLPELTAPEVIAAAQHVANPGCFATACILAGKPLADAFGIGNLQFQGITGYSAGGHKAKPDEMPCLVQFGRPHRHLPEIARYTGTVPVLTTTVGPWKQGMMVQTFVPQSEDEVIAAYSAAYKGHQGVRVARAGNMHHRVDPQGCNGTNDALVCVAGQPNGGSCIAVVLDNLGKGSAGAAAANLRLMASAN